MPEILPKTESRGLFRKSGFYPIEIFIDNRWALKPSTHYKLKSGDSVRKHSGFHTGFTLIELLVVISIIALLMSILMPALARAKKQAKAAGCLSNLHQWSTIFSMYTAENNTYFMSGWVGP